MIYAIPVNKRLPGDHRLVRGAVWFLLFLLLLSVYGRWLISETPEQLSSRTVSTVLSMSS